MRIPGLAPVDGVGTDEPVPLWDHTPVAVEFQPPDGLRPGQVGTLLDERADPLDVSATVVDLAVHGYLRIEEQSARTGSPAGTGSSAAAPRTTASSCRTRAAAAQLFEGRTEVKVSELKKTFSTQLEAVKSTMYADAVKRGFFRRHRRACAPCGRVVGFAARRAGIGLTYLLGSLHPRRSHRRSASSSAGLVLLVVRRTGCRRAPPRGAPRCAQTLGFRQYIATAEANQLKFEEGEDIFCRYLPYAIVFDEAERWAKAFASIGAVSAAGGGVTTPALLWYAGPAGWDLGSLTDSLGSVRQLDRLRDGRGARVVGQWGSSLLRRRLRRAAAVGPGER